MSFFDELKRRNVIRVGIAYLAGTWLLIQIVETLFPVFELENATIRLVVILLAIGFVPALILAWVFELSPEGISKDSGGARTEHRRYDRVVTGLLVIAVAYFAVDKFILAPTDSARTTDSSIVVLPFVNMSDDQANEFFADGITEELLNVLARVGDLRVISRSSAFAFKGKEINAADVAEQLGVAYVLEGSVRKDGNTVRVTAQLIDGTTDTHLWSDTYDRTLSDIFAIQDEIAGQVAQELELHILDVRRTKVDPRAYEIMLQVRYLVNLYEPENTGEVDTLIEKGLAIEPDYADLLWLKSRITSHKSFFGIISQEEAGATRDAVHEHLHRIVPEDPQWLIYEAVGVSDKQGRANLVAKAYKLAPTDPALVESIARFARGLGQFDVAIALGEYLVDRDPLCGRCFFRLGITYLEAGDPERALSNYEKALLYGSGTLDSAYGAGLASLQIGQNDLAEKHFQQAKHDIHRKLGMLMLRSTQGRQEEFDALLAQLEPELEWEDLMAIYAWAGDADKAFENILHAYALYPEDFGELFTDSRLARLHDDPRWQELMEELGTTPADIAAIELNIDVPDR